MLRTLREVFGLAQFRPGQEDVIRAVIDGRDTVAVMPTGAGKSLCYQLPALHLRGLTVVVSPLISLIKDQVDKLGGLGLDASPLDSTRTSHEQARVIDDMARERLEFLVTTPERMNTPDFQQTLQDVPIDLVVIDEAHCISQWGHDFRPAYLGLRRAIEAMGRPPVLALTATAPLRTIEDICCQLGLRDALVVNQGTYRPNLIHEVVPATGDPAKLREVVSIVSETAGSGIVYASTVRGAETVHRRLSELGAPASLYHGRLPASARKAAQDAFMAGRSRVMVATNAFGMGIDKADLRWIVHYNMPGSLEAYYQEAGRAGRDGEPARCVLLWGREDARTHRFFLHTRYPGPAAIRAALAGLEADRDRAVTVNALASATGLSRKRTQVIANALTDAGIVRRSDDGRLRLVTGANVDVAALADAYDTLRRADQDKLDQMTIYCQTAMCRWRKLLEYFEDDRRIDECGHCDNCVRQAARFRERSPGAREELSASLRDLIRSAGFRPLGEAG